MMPNVLLSNLSSHQINLTDAISSSKKFFYRLFVIAMKVQLEANVGLK